MDEKRLIPCGEKCTLAELPFGTLFAFGDDCIAVKSEYKCSNGLIEAFIIDSGELFWGGAKTAKEQNELMVQPLGIKEVDAVKVVNRRWSKSMGREEWYTYSYSCPECGADTMVCDLDEYYIAPNYCPNCGAMGGERRSGE